MKMATSKKITKRAKSKSTPKSKVAPTQDVPTILIMGTPEHTYRDTSMRAAYWDSLVEMQGQPVASWLAMANDLETCPKLNNHGKPDNARSWWRWFMAQGLAKAS
jgi:hypothetical protein